MLEWLAEWPFTRIGWTALQFLWISSLAIASTALALRILDPLSAKIRYRLALGTLLLLALLPGLLWLEHTGLLPPIGLADWSTQDPSAGISKEPLFTGLPKLTGVDLGENAYTIYYWTGAAWTLGAFLSVVYRLVTGLIVFLRCRSLPPFEDPVIRKRAKKLAGKLNISAPCRLRKIQKNRSPAVAGIFNPCILLPARLSSDYTIEEIDALLAHELLHIRKMDYPASLLQRCLGSLLIIQPLVWWLIRRLDREREIACDEWAARITGDRHRYAVTLFKVHRLTAPAGMNGLNIGRSAVHARIRQLLLSEGKSLNRGLAGIRYGVALSLLAVTLFSASWTAYHLHYIV